jgi:putative ABC transport system ATP-binding protein
MNTLAIHNIDFKWKTTDNAILSIDQLHIEKNKSIFLRGNSGSGKSTLLSLLAGILLPQSGHIQILGQSLSALNGKARDKFRADHIGYIFQMFNLIPYLNVIENVTLPCYFSELRAQKVGKSDSDYVKEAKRLLERVGLADTRILNKKINELSLGQQQRIAACGALIGSPELILADEPTSSLDASAQFDFLNLLTEECTANEATLIFVSHDERLASRFNQTLTLQNGTITNNMQIKG